MRQTEGNETWSRLLAWTRSSSTAERLSGLILMEEGFKSVDPSHPLGGPDGIKDIVCENKNIKWVAGAFFPRGQKKFSVIKEKFLGDAKGIKKNKAQAFVFLTNQELKLSEREKLVNLINYPVEIFHLERISLVLNSVPFYGIRLEFLDIEMTKEEQLSFMASKDRKFEALQSILERIESSVKVQGKSKKAKVVTPNYNHNMALSLLGGSNLKKCNYCSYGFLIDSLHTSGLVAGILVGYVTCPKCGSTERQ